MHAVQIVAIILLAGRLFGFMGHIANQEWPKAFAEAVYGGTWLWILIAGGVL